MKQKRMLKRKRGKKNEKNDNKGGNAKKMNIEALI